MVGYWSVLNYWNLTEQVPRVTHVQTTARKENPRPRLLGMQFRIVRVKPRKFFGSHAYRAGESRVEVTDREKTIVDCLDRPDLSGGLDQVGKALLAGDGAFDWDRTTMYLRRFGSGAAVKRFGFLVETLELTHPPEPRMLDDDWISALPESANSIRPLQQSPSDRHPLANRGQSSGGKAPEADMNSGREDPPGRAGVGCRTAVGFDAASPIHLNMPLPQSR